LEKEPAEQGLQKPALSSLMKPGSQSMQSSKLVPPVAENFPEGHAIQSLKTSWKYVPVKHCDERREWVRIVDASWRRDCSLLIAHVIFTMLFHFSSILTCSQ